EGVQKARVLAGKLARTGKAAQKAIDRYDGLRKERVALADKVRYEVNFANAYSVVAPTLFDEVNRLKGAVGAVKPFEAIEGSEYSVPLDASARGMNDWATRKFVLDSESGKIPERI